MDYIPIGTQKTNVNKKEYKEEEWANLSKEELLNLVKEFREENISKSYNFLLF